MKKYVAINVSCVLASLLVGCSQDTSTTSMTHQQSAAAVDGSKFLLTAEPDGASGVDSVRKDASDGDEVVIVGRIGGSENPWIDGHAAFSIVDGTRKACSDIPGDNCPIPWDYCCEADLAKSTALVKVVDENGALVRADAKALLNVKELTTVVVKGKAKRDDAGNLTVLATGVFVKQ